MSRLLLLLCCLPLAAADLPLQPFEYREGFEGEAPEVVLWAKNGTDPTIHFVGVSEETAAEGKRSLKVDITFGTGSYAYFGVPLRVPVAGKLRLTGQVKLAPGSKGRAGLGYNMVYPPSTHSGCSPVAEANRPGDWVPVDGDLVGLGRTAAKRVLGDWTVNLSGDEVAVFLDRWSVFLYGSPGERVTAYVDAVAISGEVPEAAAYQAAARELWTEAQVRFAEQLVAWRNRLAEAQQRIELPAGLPPTLQAAAQAVTDQRTRAAELLDKFGKEGAAHPRDVQAFEQALRTMTNGMPLLKRVAALSQEGRAAFVAAIATPLLARANPSGLPLETALADELSCAAAPGEFESLSAVVYGLKDLGAVTARAGELRGPAGTIPADAVDIRHLVWWYQGAGRNISYSPQRELVAELLVKDPGLVRVDLGAKENYLRSTAPDGAASYLPCSLSDSSMLANVRPLDSKDLQPIDLPAGGAREFWLTLRVPPGTPAGEYRGELVVTHAEGRELLPLKVRVHDLTLPAPRLIYSIYYRSTLAPDGQPTISSERKSEEQFRAELADLRDHGVLYPNNYQGHDGPGIKRVLELRREVGLPTDRFYDLGAGIGNGASPEALAAVKARVEQLRALSEPFGYRDLYFYGMDEATGDRLASQRAAWRAVQEAGGKTYVACYHGTFEAMGALLNTAVLAGRPDPKEAEKWHGVGSEAFCYANPQVGVEDPQIYRRNFGLVLRQAGFDGAMDYAYQHGFTHVWNDFDNTTYRDHNFTYPTVDGVVDTIAWEGFREGVDDVRYATALEQAIAAAPADSAVAREARSWLESLDARIVDLDQARGQMVDWIARLRAR